MTRPTLAEPITIAEWWKNRSGQAVRISISTYEGRNVFDIRVWQTTDGRLKPTTKGFAAEVRHLPRLTTALAKAADKARELGLLGLIGRHDDGGDQ
jgi:hypothetical protein